MSCAAVIYHGPGHQSRTPCRLEGEHSIHEALYGSYDQLARWKGDKVCSGYFDEPPREPEEEDEPVAAQSPEPVALRRWCGVVRQDPAGRLAMHEDYLALEETAEQLWDQRDALADEVERLQVSLAEAHASHAETLEKWRAVIADEQAIRRQRDALANALTEAISWAEVQTGNIRAGAEKYFAEKGRTALRQIGRSL